MDFFSVDDFDDLVVTVDECTDVAACEYVELPAGGIMWTSPAASVPFDISDHKDEDGELPELPFASASLSESWWDVIYGRSDEEWMAFDPDAPQDPPDPPKSLGPGRVVPMRPRKRGG